MQLSCKQCGTDFFVDTTGQCRLGKRPKDMPIEVRYAPVEMAKTPDIFGWIGKLPMVGRLIVLAVVLVGVGMGIRGALGSATEVPESLTGRVSFAAEAFAAGEARLLRMVATPDSRNHADLWIDRARPKAWAEWEPEQKPTVTVEMVFQNAAEGIAQFNAVITPPGVEPIGTNGQPVGYEIPLLWNLDSGQWYLDTRRSDTSSNAATF